MNNNTLQYIYKWFFDFCCILKYNYRENYCKKIIIIYILLSYKNHLNINNNKSQNNHITLYNRSQNNNINNIRNDL